MVKIFSILFSFYYTLLIIGLSFNLHYCGGSLAALSIYEVSAIETCCSSEEELIDEMPCCSNEQDIQQFQSEYSLNENFKISKKLVDLSFIKAFIEIVNLGFVKNLKTIINLSLFESPPDFSNPIYITFCSLIFYDNKS